MCSHAVTVIPITQTVAITPGSSVCPFALSPLSLPYPSQPLVCSLSSAGPFLLAIGQLTDLH